MTSSRTILKNLKNLNRYLLQFHQSHHSTYFEKLIAEAFSNILYLPFYTYDRDAPGIPHRVTWQGSINPITRAPQGSPDATVRCYNFHLIIEATKNTGANQWAREFASSIRHCEAYVKQNQLNPDEVYIVLVTPQLHQDTWRSLHHHPQREYRFIPIVTSAIVKILETSILAPTMRHVELGSLLNKISRSIETSPSSNDFQSNVASLLANWQREVLKVEKSAFIGVKSYRALHQISRANVSIGEIHDILLRDSIVNKYFRIIQSKVLFKDIESSLTEQGFGVISGHTSSEEPLFEPVHRADFQGRELRLIKAVEKISGKLQRQ